MLAARSSRRHIIALGSSMIWHGLLGVMEMQERGNSLSCSANHVGSRTPTKCLVHTTGVLRSRIDFLWLRSPKV